MFRWVMILGWLVVATSAYAGPRELAGPAIKRLVTGTVMYISTPLNTIIPVRYGADGSLAANAGAMGFYLGAKEDTGRWWVSRTRLCHKWNHWFDGDAQCLKLRKHGNKVFWESQKGETGTALIKRTKPIAPDVQLAMALQAPVKPDPKPQVDRIPVAQKKVVQAATPKPPKIKFQMASLGARLTVKTEKQERLVRDKTAAPKKVKVKSRKKPHVKRTAKALARNKKVTKVPKVAAALRQTSWKMNPSFRVAHVSELDVLNIRKRPSEYSPIVGAIPHRAGGVKIVGICQAWWCPVSHGAVTGWVNRFYLAAEH